MKNNEESYTVEELAEMLKVSKLTIYDLIKKGKLASYRVGRQMRVDQSDLERYKNKQSQPSIATLPSTQAIHNKVANQTLVISGQDKSLDMLARALESTADGYQPLRAYMGSIDGLVAMYQGKADIVSTHLYDGEENSYNLPYVKRILHGHAYIIIHFFKRKTGFFVAKDNPKSIDGWQDLIRPDVTMINREIGSGIRVLLDEQLKLNRLKKQKIKGYSRMQTSHAEVAAFIAQNKADIGIGTENAAKIANIDFIPMVNESYDLVILKNESTTVLIQTILKSMQSKIFQENIQALGHDITHMGEILFETV